MMMSAAVAGQASAATVVSPDMPTVVAGSPITFTVSDEFQDLISIDATIMFDPALLEFVTAVPNSNFPGADDPSNYFSFALSPSSVSFQFASTSDEGYDSSGSETLFSVTFNALAPGTATVTTSGTYGRDEDEQDNEGGGDGDGDFEFDGEGSVIIQPPVSAIPEPATWLMMLLGFGIAGGALRAQPRRPLALA